MRWPQNESTREYDAMTFIWYRHISKKTRPNWRSNEFNSIQLNYKIGWHIDSCSMSPLVDAHNLLSAWISTQAAKHGEHSKQNIADEESERVSEWDVRKNQSKFDFSYINLIWFEIMCIFIDDIDPNRNLVTREIGNINANHILK